jgi:hypothetical protein
MLTAATLAITSLVILRGHERAREMFKDYAGDGML